MINRIFFYDIDTGQSIPLPTGDEYLGHVNMSIPADIRQQAVNNFYADEPDDGLGNSLVDEGNQND